MRLARIAITTSMLVLALALPASAQVGIKGGANFAGARVTAADSDVSTDGRTGVFVGVYAARGKLLGGEIGLYYSQKGFSVGDSNVDLNYLEIPLMFRPKILFLQGYGGVNLAFQLECSAPSGLSIGGVDFNCDDMKDFEFGFKIGAGGKLLLFSLDLFYEWGTTDLWKVDNGSIKNQAFQIVLGVGI
jgi:hypothetical protein